MSFSTGNLDDSEPFDFLFDRQALPSLDVVKDHEPLEIAAEFIVHFVEGLELLPYAASRVVERHIDAVIVATRELMSRVDAVARNDSTAYGGVKQNELLTDCVTASQPHVYTRQHIVLVSIDQGDPVLN